MILMRILCCFVASFNIVVVISQLCVIYSYHFFLFCASRFVDTHRCGTVVSNSWFVMGRINGEMSYAASLSFPKRHTEVQRTT